MNIKNISNFEIVESQGQLLITFSYNPEEFPAKFNLDYISQHIVVKNETNQLIAHFNHKTDVNYFMDLHFINLPQKMLLLIDNFSHIYVCGIGAEDIVFAHLMPVIK